LEHHLVTWRLGLAVAEQPGELGEQHNNGHEAKVDGRSNLMGTMAASLSLTIDYEEAGGQVLARIREVPAAMSFGATQEEAREAVLDALRELALSYVEHPPQGGPPSGEMVEIVARTA
jgi:predicted RNase H-like HicB family nuclease